MKQLPWRMPDKWVKILDGALIAGCVAVLTYLARHSADFGDWSPLVAAVATVGLNTLGHLIPGGGTSQ